MPKERAIDLQLIKPVITGSPAAKGKIPLTKLFKEELDKLQVPYNDPCCTNDLNNSEPEIFGFRYNESTWSNLNDFINAGAVVTVDSNSKLNFSGGASNFSQKLQIDDPTCIENWTSKILFKVTTNGDGLALGSYAYNQSGVNTNLLAKFNTSTGELSMGIGNGVAGPTTYFTATGTLIFSSTDLLEMAITQRGYSISASIRNITTNSSALTSKYTYFTGNIFRTLPNTRRVSLWNLGGSFIVENLSWYIYEPKNAEMLVVGDSKTSGTRYTLQGQRYVDILNNYYTRVINASGDGDTILDVLHRIDEVINLRPKRLVMAIGSNSIRGNFPNYLEDYDTIVSKATSVGIEVFHLIGFYEGSIDQTPLSDHIYSKYPLSNIIDCLSPTNQAGLLADFAHLNDTGNQFVANTIITSGKLLKGQYTNQATIKNQMDSIQSASFIISGKGEMGSLKINEILEYADNTAALTALLPIGSVYRTGDILKIVH